MNRANKSNTLGITCFHLLVLHWNRKVVKKDQQTLEGPGTSFENQSSHSRVDLNAGYRSEREKDAISHVKEEVFKDELFKEELQLDDYNVLEDTNYDEEESRGNPVGETNLIHPSLPKEVSPPFETVICGAEVQVKQEIVEDESEIEHEPSSPDHQFPSSQTTTVIQTENVSQDKTDTYCSRFTEKISITDSLNALARLTNTVGTTDKPPTQINRDNGTLRNSIAGYGQTVCSSQPLVNAATTPNYIGVHITNRDTTTTDYIAASSTVYSTSTSMSCSAANVPIYNTTTTIDYSTATTIDYSTATSTAPSVTNSPDQPPHDVPLPQTSDCEDLEGIFISLKNVPLLRRKKTKDKLLRLVRLISELDLDPDEVSFSVTTK